MKTLSLFALCALLTGCGAFPLPGGIQDGYLSFEGACEGDRDYGHADWLTGDAEWLTEGGTLLADPRFSTAELADLELAADGWCEATGGMACLRVVTLPGSSPSQERALKPGQGLIARCGAEARLTDDTGADTWAASNRVAGAGVAIRLVADAAPPGRFLTGALHEMGHVLGLGHSADETSVMFEGGPADMCAPAPSDVVAWQASRN
jgi:hypothetical protein